MPNIERAGRNPERTVENVTLTENEVDEMLITCREITIVDVYRYVLYRNDWLTPEGKESMQAYVVEHENDHNEITDKESA